MSELDLDVPHIVTAVHQIPFSGMWVAFCTCGAELTGTDADQVRTAGQPHREAEQQRLGHAIDRSRDEERRMRREARRQQRLSRR